jgi:hypothetical protein
MTSATPEQIAYIKRSSTYVEEASQPRSQRGGKAEEAATGKKAF